MGLCTLPGDTYYPGRCATNGPESIAAAAWIQAHDRGGGGILSDIESAVKKYDPAYQALKNYDKLYHAAQDGCSLTTDYAFAAKAVVADVETAASVDGEGEVADAVDGGSTVVNLGGEGEVAGAINQQPANALADGWGTSRTAVAGKSLSELRAAGDSYVVADNTALPFADGSIDQVITNSVPIDTMTPMGLEFSRAKYGES